MSDSGALVTISRIESMILSIRGQRVMLDSDLAEEATSPEIRNTTYVNTSLLEAPCPTPAPW